MAERGAQLGNQNATKGKRWQQAINRALENRSRADGIAELDRLAELYLDTIEEMTASTPQRGPSISGLADLADRLDGKPAQALTIDADVTTRNASELTDDQLAEIAARAKSATQT